MSKAPETIYIVEIPDDAPDYLFPFYFTERQGRNNYIGYVRSDIAYGYASQVERLEKRLEVFGTNGNGDRVRLPESCDGISCRDETIANLQQLLTDATIRVGELASALRSIAVGACGDDPSEKDGLTYAEIEQIPIEALEPKKP